MEELRSVKSGAHLQEGEAQALLPENNNDLESSGEHEDAIDDGVRLRTSWDAFRQLALDSVVGVFRFVVPAIVMIAVFKRLTIFSWNQVILPQQDVVPHSDYHLDFGWDLEAPPTTREYWWTVENVAFNPDGVYKAMLLINRQFPGPMIRCNDGDTVIVHVQNMGVNATSVHWHGIYNNGTNWMDGTVGITQCPISPGGSFTYKFQVTGQSGTYWYHAHQGTQLADGLYGPLIVHARLERQLQGTQYDTDQVVMVQDHYHDLSSALLYEYLQPDQENAEPVPDGALINGKNVRDCDSLSHRKCDNSSAGLVAFNLTPAQNHRLRFINAGSFAKFQIQVDEHQFAVTEVDGTDVIPTYYHRLNINSGQRYSVVLRTDSTTASSFWMRARVVTNSFAKDNPFLEAEVRAIIQYASEETSHSKVPLAQLPNSRDWPESTEQIYEDMNTTELVPVTTIAAPPNPDEIFQLWGNFQISAWRLSRGFFNSSSWRSNVRSPSLVRFIQGFAVGNESFTTPTDGPNEAAFDKTKELVIQVNGIKTIDIIVQNFDDGNHPLHLHGYKYFVLAQGHGYFPWNTYESLDLSNPLRRDTASVQAYSWLLVRLITDNPGMWAFHCHISWHTEAGMLMQFLTRPEVVGQWDLPSANAELCRAEGWRKVLLLVMRHGLEMEDESDRPIELAARQSLKFTS